MAVQWFYKVGSQEIGPLTAQQLKQLADENRIAKTDPVRRENDTQWVAAGSVKGLFPAVSTGELPTGVVLPVVKTVTPVVSVVEPETAVEVPLGILVDAPKSGKHRVSVPPVIPEKAPEKPGVDLGFSLDGAASRSSVGKKVPPRPGVHKNVAGKAGEEPKPPLSPKELERKKFMMLVYAMGGVVVVAILILVLVYSGMFGSSKQTAEVGEAEKTESAEEAVAEEKETAPVDIFDTSDSKDKKDAEKTEEGDAAASEAAETPTEEGEKAESGDKTADGTTSEVEGYTNAKKSRIRLGDVMIRIRQAVVDTPAGFLGTRGENSNQYLFVKLEISNTNDSKILDYPAWGMRSKTLTLKDNHGNNYKSVSSQTLGTPIKGQQRTSVQVTGVISDILVFTAPVPKAEYLLLDLPSLGDDAEEKFRFLIPKEMFREPPQEKKIPKPAQAKGSDEEAPAEDAEEEITASGVDQADLKVRKSDELSQSLDDLEAENNAASEVSSEEAAPAEEAATGETPAEDETSEEDDGLDEETREMRKMMRENGLQGSEEEEESGPELNVQLSPELQAAEKEFNRQAEEERKAELRNRNKNKKKR